MSQMLQAISPSSLFESENGKALIAASSAGIKSDVFSILKYWDGQIPSGYIVEALFQASCNGYHEIVETILNHVGEKIPSSDLVKVFDAGKHFPRVREIFQTFAQNRITHLAYLIGPDFFRARSPINLLVPLLRIAFQGSAIWPDGDGRPRLVEGLATLVGILQIDLAPENIEMARRSEITQVLEPVMPAPLISIIHQYQQHRRSPGEIAPAQNEGEDVVAKQEREQKQSNCK